MLKLVCIFINILLVFSSCDYKKFGSEHTMCKYAGKTGCDILKSGFTAAKKKEMVDLHNEYRQKIANGSTRYHPAAANMIEMAWDSELEKIAQTWVYQCSFAHDKRRNSNTFGYAGQNMFAQYLWGGKKDSKIMVKDAFDTWFSEGSKARFNEKDIESYNAEKDAGHYSQIIWANTRAIGCGFAFYKSKDKQKQTHLIGCNYGPGGNLMSTPVYVAGKPCSQCTGGCSKKYPSLCS